MTAATGRPYSSRLAVRFAIILAAALLPAGLIAFLQTLALQHEVRGREEAALLGATLQAAASDTTVIARYQGIVVGLAIAVPRVIQDSAACIDLMSKVALSEPMASVVAFVPVSGLMTCSSGGRTFDFSDDALFQRVRDAEAPYLWVNPNGPISGTAILGISQPVYDAAGRYLGYTVMAVPQDKIEAMRAGAGSTVGALQAPAMFWTFDRSGTILTSSDGPGGAVPDLPATPTLAEFMGNGPRALSARSAQGRQTTYAVVPIIPNELYLMSSFSTNTLASSFPTPLAPYLPTFLMWFIGLLGAGVAAEILVTRHVRTLNRSIVDFARGDRRLQDIDLKGAPAELDELAQAYLAMTGSIVRSEAELEDSLHQKEVLLREVHHRVKNNLQLISSIMNIQMRTARTGEARDLLKNLQERVMSLATVHRGLYQTSGQADVRARELILDIVRQILAMSSGPEKPFETSNDIDDLRIVPDQAVPLALLLTEALTNAIKHAGATRERPGRLAVNLKRAGGSGAMLEVVNSMQAPSAPAVDGPDLRIGSQLIAAFVHQLGGAMVAGETDGEYRLQVTFTVLPLALAENRQMPAASG